MTLCWMKQEKLYIDEINHVEYYFSLYKLEEYVSELKVGNIRVINGERKIVTDSIVDMSEYLETIDID
ncbi:MAG TPA: hypothetical protein VK121_05505 [Pseudogracilibacillus sp.]|nr:hypothetical protein [Pseudogracilibacillus sp.]